MKLKSKMTIGILCCLLLALVINCALVIHVSKKNITDHAQSDALTELENLIDLILEQKVALMKMKSDVAENAMMRYLFLKKERHAEQNTLYVLQSGEKMVVNDSRLDPAAILHLNKEIQGSENTSAIIKQSEKTYILVGENLSIGERDYQVSVVQDISDLFRQLRQLMLKCMGIGAIISVAASVVLFLLINTFLRPLEQLKMEADAISTGEFQRRTEMKRKDELASLSHSFHVMAESIHRHILEVEETSEARNRMIHALAHEMRTPVTAISGYSYMIRSTKLKEEQKEEALEFIDLEARRLERLSGKLTGLVGLDKCEIQLEKVNLENLKKQMELLFRDREDIALFVEPGEMIGDQDLLLMLITNLCDNARKAQAHRIEVRISSEGIWVKDNGNGISKKDQEHIFEAFYQGDSSRNQEGFGLGLTLCQKIATLHNTELHVESEPGEGSMFYLYNSLTTL